MKKRNTTNVYTNTHTHTHTHFLGHPSIPSYESRISLVKLLIEISQYTQALSVLELLQKENDEVLDLWYLYGWCYFLMGQDSQNGPDQNLTVTHWEDARDCLINYEKVSYLKKYTYEK